MGPRLRRLIRQQFNRFYGFHYGAGTSMSSWADQGTGGSLTMLNGADVLDYVDESTISEESTQSPIRLGESTRPAVRGKFLFVDDRKFYVKGVTYGAFSPGANKQEYWDYKKIERDFAQMAASGINTVRIPHTLPPRSLLDAALRHGLFVMVGLSAEQYAGYLIDRESSPDIEELVRRKVSTVAGHPALLCYALGNEIPSYMVRWIGRRNVEHYLRGLYAAVKEEDPEGIVTYVNYPTTEYLDLSFLDLISFNVYLESEAALRSYLPRLQNIAANRPLIMSEVGIDSMRNGEIKQAKVLDWQIRAAFECGCAGVFVFSWTDEWHRAGAEVQDWEFGITRRDRSPKPAMVAVKQAFVNVPFSSDREWPRISVVVCSYNGSRTIRDTLEGLKKVRYPDFEVIVVDDGSTDSTASIAAEYDVKLIRTPNRGLSSARNTGWQAATGEIVAYTDDDAYPDPDWLTYLAEGFRSGEYVAIGGPNIPPPEDGPIAACVANSPGGPVHVLLSDTEAEHIPGCNMAFLRSALEAVDGFDVQFRVAGDDVDICWQLQERGWKLGFSAAAQVWHHRRNSVKTYWRQQKGYGKAEALLEKKWPQKYNFLGHLTWHGRVYSQGLTRLWGTQWRVYHGQWGSAPFQSLYQSGPPTLHAIFTIPEWYLANICLLLLSLAGLLWRPLLFAFPLLLVSSSIPIANACASAARSRFPRSESSSGLRVLTALLHMMQPAARLYGRLIHGLTLWRNHVPFKFAWPSSRKTAVWTENWVEPESRLRKLEDDLKEMGIPVRCGGDFDDWDLAVGDGFWGGASLLMAAEDHGAGTQYVRFRIQPNFSALSFTLAIVLAFVAVWAGADNAWLVSIMLGSGTVSLSLKGFLDCGRAVGAMLKVAKSHSSEADIQ
jgi:GT2 family glycosyltransferase